MQSTVHQTLPQVQKSRKWHFLDAKNKVLGRLATQAAVYLMGKHKPSWSPHMDCGDFVIIVNAADVRVTGKKLEQKLYFRHSGYPAGGKTTALGKLLQEKPERVIELAIKRMLPKNRLASRMMRRLRVYRNNQHPHEGQFKNA